VYANLVAPSLHIPVCVCVCVLNMYYYYLGPETYCTIADSLQQLPLKSIIRGGEMNIVKHTWVQRCINNKQFENWYLIFVFLTYDSHST
jgi:hypothetical protein